MWIAFWHYEMYHYNKYYSSLGVNNICLSNEIDEGTRILTDTHSSNELIMTRRWEIELDWHKYDILVMSLTILYQ